MNVHPLTESMGSTTSVRGDTTSSSGKHSQTASTVSPWLPSWTRRSSAATAGWVLTSRAWSRSGIVLLNYKVEMRCNCKICSGVIIAFLTLFWSKSEARIRNALYATVNPNNDLRPCQCDGVEVQLVNLYVLQAYHASHRRTRPGPAVRPPLVRPGQGHDGLGRERQRRQLHLRVRGGG